MSEVDAKSIEDSGIQVLKNLSEEASFHRKRSVLLLGFAVSATAIGLLLLVGFSLSLLKSTSANGQPLGALGQFTYLRIAIVSFFQGISFWLFKQTKLSLVEYRYVQNERTTMASKLVALKVAIKLRDQSILLQVVAELLRTERNVVLKKGESTPPLEQDKLDGEMTRFLLKGVSDAIEKIGKK